EVRVSDEMMPGGVSLPYGWGDGANRRVASRARGPNVNALIDQHAIGPLAGMAHLNGFPVAVETLGERGSCSAASPASFQEPDCCRARLGGARCVLSGTRSASRASAGSYCRTTSSEIGHPVMMI